MSESCPRSASEKSSPDYQVFLDQDLFGDWTWQALQTWARR
jgi:hypothetical protein